MNRIRMNIRRLFALCTHLLVLCTTAMLSACSSSNKNATSSTLVDFPVDTISRMGEISFAMLNLNPSESAELSSGLVSGYGKFTDYGQVMSAAYLDERYSIPPADTCKFYRDSGNDGRYIPEFSRLVIEFESQSRRIDAGESLTLSTPAGTWSELRYQDDTALLYAFESRVTQLGDLPADSTINIPGGEFPAFGDVSISAVDRITEADLSNVVDEIVTVESQLTWSLPVRTTANSYIVLTLLKDYESTADMERAYIKCTVLDDGEFSFPAVVEPWFSEHDFRLYGASLSRIAVTSEVRDNAAVIIKHEARYNF